MNQNSLETYEKISEAITTDKKTVSVDMFDSNGNLKTIQVPAFGYLKREIERLDTNLKSLSGLSSGDTTVKMADGTFRQISKSKLKTPAKSLTSIAAPNEFISKSNNFFESFLNPLLQIQLDVDGQVPADTEKIKQKRYLVDSTDVASTEWFDDNIKGLDNLEINNLVSLLETNLVRYEIDEEIVDAPVRSSRYYGGFDIAKVRTAQRKIVVDGVSVTKSVKLYTVNKFSYSDQSQTLTDTETLKIGDELLVNSGNASTKYRVVALNTDTLELELLLLEGYESIKIGADQLKIYKNKDAYSSIDINVGFDERAIIFIKPVDPESNLEAEEWSPGSAIYTNELLITLESGEVQNLADYYKAEVADFGQLIKALKDDSIPPATLGVTPDAPTVDAANFKVVQVNAHMTGSDAFQKVKKLNSTKVTTEENIKKLDEDLSARRAAIATKKYSTLVEKDRDRNELTSVLDQRNGESKLYASLVNEIRTTANSSSISNISAKYRVRGFWAIPAAKLSGETIPQEIVQFKIQYRYVSSDGTPSNIDQIEFNDDGTSKTGVFSNWIEKSTTVRKRIKDETTGKFKWDLENVEDGQAVNINQLDIAIQNGEIVEFRIKSVSEAGWPSNPIESDWSNVTRIEFPAGTSADESVVTIVNENSNELAKVKLIEELQSAGVYQHIGDSFTVNEKYFAHESSSIASGFLTAEQSPVSLFEKLIQMQKEIDSLKEQIAGAVGELSVRLVYEDGSSEIVQNNSTKQVFAGYYTDEIANLQIKKGHIVTKTFKVVLENSKATPLELISRLYGDRSSVAYNSSNTTNNGFGVEPTGTIDDVVVNDAYYINEGKYDLVASQYQNTASLDLNQTYFNESPYQSAQLRGQFLYSRYKNLANDAALYATSNIDASNNSNTLLDYEYGMFDISTLTPTNNASDYIFAGYNGAVVDLIDLTTVTNATYDSGILLHRDHPELTSTTTYSDIYDFGSRFVQAKTIAATNQQTAYYYDSGLNRTVKMAFEPNDQYLLGGKSCGAYLFMSPLSASSLSINSDNSSGNKIVNQGENNGIAIDIIYQYRMTDYSGDTSTSNGFLAGESLQTKTNLTYSKRIGLDVVDAKGNAFKFDLEVFSKYKA